MIDHNLVLFHALIVLEELTQKRYAMEPVLDFVIALVYAVCARVERGHSGRGGRDIATCTSAPVALEGLLGKLLARAVAARGGSRVGCPMADMMLLLLQVRGASCRRRCRRGRCSAQVGRVGTLLRAGQ